MSEIEDSLRKGLADMEKHRGWIGVDLDGTLAHYDTWRGFDCVGAPIPAMLDRVRAWIKEGREVRIFTARACIPDQLGPVKQWLKRFGLGELQITNVRDLSMKELWDDRCVQVVPNTGERVDGADGVHP